MGPKSEFLGTGDQTQDFEANKERGLLFALAVTWVESIRRLVGVFTDCRLKRACCWKPQLCFVVSKQKHF